MAAGIGDLFTKAGNGTRPVPTTLNAILASGASPGTANCAALTGWNNATAIHFVIYTIDTNGKKVAGSQTDWKGIVSGTTITGLVLKAGTNNGYSVGAIVEAAPTAAWADDLGTGLLVEHKQTGAHSAVTTDSITNAGVLTQTGNVALAGKIFGSDASTPIIPLANYMISGGVWSLVSGLNGAMTILKAFVNNKYVGVAAIASRAFTASKDTYIDVKDDGTVVYVEVANGATVGMTLTLNSDSTSALRIAKVVTSGAAITNVFQFTFDSTNTYYGVDPLGNSVARKSPYRHSTMSEMTADGTLTLAGAFVDLPNLATITKITTGGECEVDFVTPVNNGTSAVDFSLGVAVDGTMQNDSITRTRGATGGAITQQVCRWRGYLAAGSHTFKIQYHLTGAGTVSVYGVKGGTSAFGDVRATLRVTENV